MNDDTKALAVVGQALTTKEFGDQYNQLIKFCKSKLIPDKDYGVIPGTKKKALYKPGAEKVAFLFQLKVDPKCIEKVEDWENGFFYYKYRCELIHFATGKFAGAAERSCNSHESKYAYTKKAERWATEEEKKLSVKRKKNPDYPGSFDLYLPKSAYEQADQVNTIMAMAQKRAIVAAVVHATMASEIFDADVDDDEKDQEAPNRPVTKDEDPKRVRVMSDYFQAATDRGFPQEAAKKAAYRKMNVTSMTDISTNDIEKLTEELIKTIPIKSAKEVDTTIEAEVVEEPKNDYPCKGKKHEGQPENEIPK